MSKVNIPRSITDDFYRYTIPIIRIKIEGKGNGVRTVLVNIVKITKCLNRPVDHILKFIEIELGTQSKCDNNGCIIRGRCDVEQLAVILNKYIDIYVLCDQCNNPETALHNKVDYIAAKCAACGHIGKIKDTHKLSARILKSTQIKNNSTKVPEIEHKWSLDTSRDAINSRKQVLMPDSAQIKNIFIDLFSDGNIRTGFYQKIEHIKPLINDDKSMLLLLRCIENFMLQYEGISSMNFTKKIF